MMKAVLKIMLTQDKQFNEKIYLDLSYQEVFSSLLQATPEVGLQ